MKHLNCRIVTIIALALFFTTLTPLLADDTKTTAKEQKPATDEKAETKQKSGPFHAKVVSVDKTANSLVIGKRTFYVNAQTKVLKDGDQKATLDDAKVGEIASGYFEEKEGKLQLAKLHFGAKPDPAKKKSETPTKNK